MILLGLSLVVFTPQKGGRHNAQQGIGSLAEVVFPPQKGGRHNRLFVFLPFYGCFLAFLFKKKADRDDVNGEIF